MVLQESRLRVSDNSGAKRSALIRLSKRNVKRSLEALVRLTEVYPSQKVKKGQIYLSCIISLKKSSTRYSGVSIKSYNNDVILLKKDKTPLGNRVYRPIFLELRFFGLSRICSIARSIY